MARSGWQAERDGSFTMLVQSRRQKPPPATPWGKLELEWSMKVSLDFHWRGSLKEVLETSIEGMRHANRKARKAGKGSRWASVEAFLFAWAKNRRLIMDMDPTQDLVTLAPIQVDNPPNRNPQRLTLCSPACSTRPQAESTPAHRSGCSRQRNPPDALPSAPMGRGPTAVGPPGPGPLDPATGPRHP